MRLHRVGAVYRRHMYVALRSFPRILDVMLWPFVDLFLWGLVTVYLRDQHVHLAAPVAFLLGGLLLWDIVFRTKNQVAVPFLEEAWSRNIILVLASPLRATEYVAGATMWGLTAVGLGWLLMVIAAWAFFAFGVLTLGLPLSVFMLALIVFGVSLALFVVGLLLRFGEEAEIMAWALAFIVLPFSAVYYPITVLPGWAQAVAAILPTSYVFGAMRAVLAGSPAPWGQLGIAVALDVVWLAAGFAFARRMLVTLKRRGYVTRFI
jgi:ABC-2 type transport system permease protein